MNAFDNGFGLETDIRDHNRKIVISHDPPTDGSIAISEMEKHFLAADRDGKPIALNVKSDGIADLLDSAPFLRSLSNAFFFDMSVPQMMVFEKHSLAFFTRISEVENEPSLYDVAAGVWIDQFYRDWADAETILRCTIDGKLVCIVSPELHGRDYRPYWEYLGQLHEQGQLDDRAMLCTDYPEQARDLFT